MEIAISDPTTPSLKADDAIAPQIIDSPEKVDVTPKNVDQGDLTNATRAERPKLPRIKSDSDIEILSSDDDDERPAHNTSEDNDDPLPSSQENDEPLPSSQERDEDSDESVDSEMDSESDGDIVKMDGSDYAKINSDEDDEVSDDEDSEMVLSQESERSVKKVVKTAKPQHGDNKRTGAVAKALRKDYRTFTWRLKARSMKILNKRMQIMDENNDTNNDQDKADLKVLQQQSPTQPDGDAQKIILAQLKEQFYQQQSAKLKTVEPVAKPTTVALDDSDEVVESKSEEKSASEKNGHDIEEIDIYADEEEEEEVEEEDEFDELTPRVNGTGNSEQPSNDSEVKDDEPMQIDLSSEGDLSMVVSKADPKPETGATTPKKEHNTIDFEDLLDNAPQEKAVPSTEQCDITPQNAINPKQVNTSTPKATTPAPLPEQSKENEITSSQSVVEKPAPIAEPLKICKVEEVESDAKTPPPLPPRNRKRQLSLESEPAEELIVPSKKLKAELEANFGAHDRLLREYIQHSTNSSTHLDDIQTHAAQLAQEIQQLNELVRIKEMEWNNMVHLKKVKEEILLRLNRKINVMEMMNSKVSETEDTGAANPLITNLLSQPFQKHTNRDSLGSLNNSMIPLIASTPSNSALATGGGFNLVAMEAAATSNSSVFSTASSTAAILQGRANMKSADLAKEKVNAAKVHRNILPKPTLPNHQQILNNLAMSAAQSSAAAAASGGPSSQEKAQTAAVAVLNAYHAQLSSLQSQVDLLNGHAGGGGGGGMGGTMTQQQQQNFYNSQIQMGRQGVIKDVKSIIADYRQKHPENVPRRGRRLKGLLGQPADSKRLSELGILLSGMDGNSRPSSTESMHSNSNNTPFTTTTTTAANNNGISTMDSFKDVLAQFATLSQNERNLISSVAAAMPGTNTSSSSAANFLASLHLPATLTTTTASGKTAPPPAYPEVTLHPVGVGGNTNFLSGGTDHKPNISSNNNTVNNNNNKNVSNNNLGASNSSLLHGILTKSQNRTNTSFTSSFSPTLARLLTAPERISPQNAFHQSTSALTPASNPIMGGNANSAMSAALAAASAGLNLSKMGQQNSEITITPVMSAAAAAAVAASNTSGLQMTLLQQQLQQQNRLKQEPFVNMDEDSADRLVIDESFNDQQQTQSGQGGQEFHENEVPECQGCKKREAQFVCAGCGNQWYCSRECQVNAWDDHSDVCTG